MAEGYRRDGLGSCHADGEMELDDGELVAAKRIEHLATKLQIGSELSSWNFALQPFDRSCPETNLATGFK